MAQGKVGARGVMAQEETVAVFIVMLQGTIMGTVVCFVMVQEKMNASPATAEAIRTATIAMEKVSCNAATAMAMVNCVAVNVKEKEMFEKNVLNAREVGVNSYNYK